jgi:putative RecB family exonuclease
MARSIAGLKPLEHLSHSSRETLERCAKSWFLKYRTPAPRRPALWSAGGSAVHEVTEAWDRLAIHEDLRAFDLVRVWNHAFGAQIEKIRKVDPNEWNWGRSASEPIEVWRVQGLEFVRSYIAWRKRSPYTIWTTPDGQPAIELDVSGMLPGCPVEIKGYVDRIFHDPVFDKLIDVDLKSGKRPPKNGNQFGTYAALVEVKYGVKTDLGVPFLTRKATLGRPYDLAEFTPEAVGKVFGETWDKIQAGEFPAEGIAKNDCFICDVASSCAAKNGPLAARYDPDHPDYSHPPF